jgi:5-formyltetrahydrofolate cyclo-ligase
MAAQKHALRRKMRRLRRAISPDFAALAGDRAAAHLLARDEIANIELVGVYAAMRGELPTTPLIDALLERGIALAFPRVIVGQGRLMFHRVSDPAALVIGAFGIPEPDPTAPVVPVENIGAFVVPGLGFDLEGWRLGWGKGHYDQTLADCATALRIGYCYEAQILAAVPAADHDLAMHWVVTETRAHTATPWIPSVS